jgi:beta-lactamase superfamily II metal-dependent hydrolase
VLSCAEPPSPVGAPPPSAATAPGSSPTTPAPPTSSDAPTRPAPSSSAAPLTACGEGHKLVVHFYDVDQALAVLVDLPDGRHILVDTGDSPRRPSCGDVCASADRHLLAKLGTDLHGAPIDLLWITHQHSDHIGGAPEVLTTFHIGTYVDNGRDARKAEIRRPHRAAEERGTVVTVVDPDHRGAPITGSADVKLTPILPSFWPPSCSHDANDCSIALRIDFCASSVLFVGDAEHDEEAQLDPHGRVSLLQVAHHGSETSTTPGLTCRSAITSGLPSGTATSCCPPRATARSCGSEGRERSRGPTDVPASASSIRAELALVARLPTEDHFPRRYPEGSVRRVNRHPRRLQLARPTDARVAPRVGRVSLGPPARLATRVGRRGIHCDASYQRNQNACRAAFRVVHGCTDGGPSFAWGCG